MEDSQTILHSWTRLYTPLLGVLVAYFGATNCAFRQLQLGSYSVSPPMDMHFVSIIYPVGRLQLICNGPTFPCAYPCVAKCAIVDTMVSQGVSYRMLPCSSMGRAMRMLALSEVELSCNPAKHSLGATCFCPVEARVRARVAKRRITDVDEKWHNYCNSDRNRGQ